MKDKTPEQIVEAIPTEKRKAVWHALGEHLKGTNGVHTLDSGDNGPPPPPGTHNN